MAENPTGGAGGLASSGAGDQAGEAVSKPTFTPPRPAQSSGEAGGAGGASVDVTEPDEGPAPALGAGGTSVAGQEPGPDNGFGGKGASGAKMAGAAAVVPAAGVAGQVMLLAMFINYLKGMMMAGIALASNLLGMAVGLMLAGAKTVVGAVMGIGGMVSGAIGGAVSAATAGVASVVAGVSVGAMVVVGAVAGVTTSNEIAMKDDGLRDCRVTATRALDKVEGAEGSIGAVTLANAKTVFGVLSAWGMPDENIAGILGNWDAESGVDPTSVQGYFSSPQVMSDEKRSAASNTDNGIGLGQWTFGRNANLRTYADGHGEDWWTLEMQLGFMLSAAEGSDANVVRDMITTSQGTPKDAALHFHDKWERSADTASMAERRGVMANKWMGLFSGWEKNQALADSILAQAGTTVTGAETARADAVLSECNSVDAKLTMKEGGLTLEEATELMEIYKVEGEEFLRSRYGAGGPGDCGYGKADNCVGFSTYWVNKFTSFQQYAMGNGVDTAGSMARMMGKELTQTPTVYSVASGPSTVPAGHTFIVLGIQGDQAVIGEASCGSNHVRTRARLMPISTLTNGSWEFVDVSDLLTEVPAEA
jgi:hypothetical protein